RPSRYGRPSSSSTCTTAGRSGGYALNRTGISQCCRAPSFLMSSLQARQRETQSLRKTEHVARVIGKQMVRIPGVGDVDAGVRLDRTDQLIQVGDSQCVIRERNRGGYVAEQSQQVAAQGVVEGCH